MNKIITFSLIGKNSPNFITNVFKNLYLNQVNVLESKIFNFPKNTLISANVEIYHNINISNIINKYSDFKDLDNTNNHLDKNNCINLFITNADEPGIIHQTLEILNDHGLIINKMESYVTTAPISSQRVFNMNIEINNSNKKFNFNIISENLTKLGSDFQII
tara:strand:- start:317 stop:802 length:486 start_codon:yes stop_codon:yes gene_type:complete